MTVNYTDGDFGLLRTLNHSVVDVDVPEALQTPFNIAVMSTCLAVIFIISIFGNIFVFLVFYRRPILVTISNRFIVNLTVCNILETIFVMPVVFTSLVAQDWVFGKFLCQVTGFLMNVTFAVSTLTLVVISVDRYCAVVTPLHYTMRITPTRSVLIILLVWLLAVSACLPPLMGWNHYEYQEDKSVCTVLWESRIKADQYYNIFLVVLCFILPLVVILWAYGVIFRAARNISERTRKNSVIPNVIDALSQTPLRNDRRRSSTVPILVQRLSVSNRNNSVVLRLDEWKAAVTSCIVVSTFIFCWLLYFIVIILESVVQNPSEIRPDIKTVSILLAMLNCAFNPLVYVFRNKAPRLELKTILGLRTKRDSAYNGVQLPDGSRRESVNTSQSISRQGSQESDIIQKLHHVTTTTTLASMVVADENDVRTVAAVRT